MLALDQLHADLDAFFKHKSELAAKDAQTSLELVLGLVQNYLVEINK